MAASGKIKDHIGFYGNFVLGMLFALLSMFYAILFLKVSNMNTGGKIETFSLVQDSRTMRPPEVQKEIEMMTKQSEDVQSQAGQKGQRCSHFYCFCFHCLKLSAYHRI